MKKFEYRNSILYHADCREIYELLENVDHVITDPPYEKQAHKKGRRTSRNVKTGENADLDFEMITEDLRNFIAKESTRISNGWNIFFCQVEAVAAWRDAIEAHKGNYKRPCVWIKPDSTPQLNGQMPAMGYENFVCQWAGQGHSRWNAGGKRGVYTHYTNQPDRTGEHPTEKPLPLMKEIIADFTNEGDLIFDPFAGSGTTGVACAMMNRHFIGVELDEKYFDLACHRIEEAYEQLDLFVAPEPKMKTIDMFK